MHEGKRVILIYPDWSSKQHCVSFTGYSIFAFFLIFTLVWTVSICFMLSFQTTVYFGQVPISMEPQENAALRWSKESFRFARCVLI